MYNLERFQALHVLPCLTQVPGTPGDLKAAAATSLGKFVIPKGWSKVQVKKLGMVMAAAGGVQTTAGTAILKIAGTAVNSSVVQAPGGSGVDMSASFVIASVASHAAWSAVEMDLDPIATLANTPGQYGTLSAAPQYPTLSDGQLAEIVVDTQGVGAGDQTAYFYLLVSLDPTT